MTSLILQPCGNSDASEHFADTIQTPVDISRIKQYLTDQQLYLLEPIFNGRKTIPVWGVTPGRDDVNISKWNKVQSGDVALFSKDGKIFAASSVVEKIHNKQLAVDLWQTNSEGMTWEYVYFLDELVNQDIPYLTFNKAVGYKENNIIRGFSVLDPGKSARAISKLDLFSERYVSEVAEEDFETAVDTLLNINETDLAVITKGRAEQGYLRKHLFGKKLISNCCICSDDYPVDMLCASHIKKRSSCTHEERLDFKNIVAPMCVNGCDAIFEKGYIIVNKQGIIESGRSDVDASGLNKKIQTVAGLNCSAWNETTEIYFEWHRNKYYKGNN